MSYRTYVGNLSYLVSEQDLRNLFASEGSHVEAVKIVNDFITGKSRGFGFVEVSTREEMESEARRLNGRRFKGRRLVVSEAKANQNKKPAWRRAAHS